MTSSNVLTKTIPQITITFECEILLDKFGSVPITHYHVYVLRFNNKRAAEEVLTDMYMLWNILNNKESPRPVILPFSDQSLRNEATKLSIQRMTADIETVDAFSSYKGCEHSSCSWEAVDPKSWQKCFLSVDSIARGAIKRYA